MSGYWIDEAAVRGIEAASKRLYSEKRMDANEMRDLAQVLEAIARQIREVPL